MRSNVETLFPSKKLCSSWRGERWPNRDCAVYKVSDSPGSLTTRALSTLTTINRSPHEMKVVRRQNIYLPCTLDLCCVPGGA